MSARLAAERLADLMRQGFMKPARGRECKERPMVACELCQNWHRKGKHTASAEERRAQARVAELQRRLAAERRKGLASDD